MAQAYNINKEKIKILPLGIKTSPFLDNSSNFRSKTLKVLYVSRLEKRKGALTLIEAIPKVLKKFANVEFIFIGRDRPHAPNCRYFKDFFLEKFKEFSDKVHFLGYLSDAELNKYYLESDIFIVPSVYESFGLIFIEAMSYCKPVIGCQAGGIPEVISDGITGFLVPPFDSESLAIKILKLLNDEDLRKKMGLHGRRRVECMFNRDKMARNTVEFYKEVINDFKLKGK